MVAECSASKEVRDKVWQQALECLKSQGVVDETCLGVLGKEEEWYRLTMGAAVSGVFEKLALDLPTHFAHRKSDRSGRKSDTVAVYTRVLALLAPLLLHAFVSTKRAILAIWDGVKPLKMPTFYGLVQMD